MSMRTGTEKVASSPRPAIEAAEWLGLAAAPTFAVMACFSAVGTAGMSMCSAASAFMPIDDMALMYALMSLFHLSPWMKLVSARSQRPNIPPTQTEGD
ncbi:MAG: hypothetical protein IBJ07_20405 [Rhizobiaceae bacterium]|nr:hypothetical protein [Rhizobiaceae bacterium]